MNGSGEFSHRSVEPIMNTRKNTENFLKGILDLWFLGKIEMTLNLLLFFNTKKNTEKCLKGILIFDV